MIRFAMKTKESYYGGLDIAEPFKDKHNEEQNYYAGYGQCARNPLLQYLFFTGYSYNSSAR